MQVLKSGSRKFDKFSNDWKVFSTTGKHMFTTSQRRAEWYIRVAGAIVREPEGCREIQLIRKPKGEGFHEDEVFGLTARVNQCVVCGETENMQRHHVVPYHYRKFMPIEYKSRSHHDVVLICRTHHEEYEQIAKDYKTEIAKLYNVKTIEELNNQYITEVVERLRKKFKINRLLRTILDQFNDVPIKNIESIAAELKVLVGFNVLDMTLDEITKIAKKLSRAIEREKKEVSSVDEYYHGNLVIQRFKSHEDFVVFIRGWRQHFLDKMKPKHMPLGWSVDFRCRK